MRRAWVMVFWWVLLASTADAQTTGGSFGGSSWGSGAARPRPPPVSTSRPRPRPRPTTTWGSNYDYNRNRYNRRRTDGGAECAATMAVVLTGLVGALVTGARGKKK